MSTHVDMLAVILLLWTLIIVGTEGQKSIQLRYLIVSESTERELPSWVSEYTASEVGAKVSDTIIMLDRQREDEAYSQLCDALSSGVTIVLDLTWYPWSRMDKVMEDKGVTVIRSQLGDQGLIQAYNQYLELRNATDLAIVFENEDDLDRGLCELMRTSGVRLWAEWSGRRDVIAAIKSMRPVPEHYAAVGSRDYVTRIYKQAIEEKMTRMPYRWTLLVTDYMTVARGDVTGAVYTLSADRKECCALQNQTAACNCPDNIKLRRPRLIVRALLTYMTQVLTRVQQDLESYVVVYTCDSVAGDNSTRDTVYRQLADDSDAGNDTLFYWDSNRLSLSLRSRYRFLLNGANDDIENGAKGGGTETVAAWSAGEDIKLSPGVELPTLKRYFRIGTTAAIPWTMHSLDPSTGEHMYNEQGEPVYHGYCIDLIQKISEIMEFDYDMVTPKQGTFGHKLTNGTWDGVIGDLTRGEVDIAIAALTMTAEREEVIDFVAPYFEQTGILIAIRKPVRKTSLFKFMTVLRTEVWLCIIAALVLTGVMIWLLDKYSPYSARNNPEAYPYPCRQFTLKESFWFALTSFTPQGGGEAPKALSSRTLVAAYWLFVVLMLATFTANLAAFLTVERMQAPVSSLEQLARQSRINYTVVEGSTVHQYFINMKHAEDTLYQVWKEITLNATSDQSKYRVWDYPIREQYGHILLAINSSRPVPNATVGFQEVIQHQDADFAFIHDAAEIKYEVTQNCNLTEVGEVFAEQPYAIAVQQGSHLQEEISRALLDLQKDRVLEMLNTRYWNESARNMCPDSDDSEGITLESLGGVFIATLVGLAIAMLTLVWEVFYYKNKEKKTNVDMKQTVTLGGDIFKPVTDNISYINVLPKPNRATNRNNKNIIKDYTA